MDFLYFLEGIRSNFPDSFFLAVTNLGDETIFLILSLFFFWCVDKYQGYFLMMVGFSGSVINQMLKSIFRIPRPWILDKNFTAVEAAKERAFGYSFPSGHSQISVGLFGTIFKCNKNTALRIICALLCVLIPFSRLYLGVHTPLDVITSVVCAIILIFVFDALFKKIKANPNIMYIPFFAIMLLLSILLVFMYKGTLPKVMSDFDLASTQKALLSLLGSAIGILFAFILDNNYTHFDTKAPFSIQLLKLLLGLLLVIGVKEGLKPALDFICGSFFAKDCIRYAIVVFIAGGIWPMTFKFFAKLNKK